jgi:hypothetical protein
MTQKLDIDLVYLWVDGSDPAWLAKKDAFAKTINDHSELNSKGHYANNDELKYSLRSVEKCVPWIHKIYIVTDQQIPDWLDLSHPKIKIIDHTELLPSVALPCYNSIVLEYFLYKIPDLSEYFLYANDDMFFNADVAPDFFFAEDGFPIVRLKRKIFGKWHYPLKKLVKKIVGKRINQYYQAVVDGALWVKEKTGKYYSGIPHHNVDAYRKSDYITAVEDVFSEQAKRSQSHHVRTYGDLYRAAFAYYALATGHAHLKYVGRKEACRINVYKTDYEYYFRRYNPKLFCMNDATRKGDSDRLRAKAFLTKHFPVKSSFEL